MNHTAFFEALKAGRIAGCYLFEGTEEYIKQQALKNLCARLLPEGLEQMNLTDLIDPAPDALIAAAETLPFLAEKRVVVVRECALLTAGRKSEDEDRAAALMDYVPRIPPTACVVFYVKGKADGRKKLYTLLKKQNAIVDFSPMNDAECADWCIRALRRMGKRLSGENAARLVFTVGRDAALLRQEMDKLCAYLGEREEIAAEDIDQICTRSTECTVFQMVDAQVAGNNDTEMHSILAEYELPYRFEPEIEEAAQAIDARVTTKEIAQRRDFRGVTTFTVDPADAKDFDDALSVRKIKDGVWEVGVHIADVTHYVRPHSVIDDEAVERGTSVYLVDRTVPMLPERLSNELCSLRPHETSLCFSAVFTLNENLDILEEWFGRTVIHSDRRFTYAEAQEIIETGRGDYAEEVLTLNRLAQALRKERFRNGAISFDREEVKFRLDENGKPLGVYFKEQKESNQMIEEFMLLANRRVAEFCGKRRTESGRSAERTMVYRVHDTPSEEKLDRFRQFILRFGHIFKATKGRAVAKELNKLFKQIKGTTEENAVATMAVRSMAKAYYTTDNIGHYGLAFPYYTHFTSPIRRYPDMMVHRLLARYLAGGKPADKTELEDLCARASDREVVAAEAERASIKYKMVEFMKEHIGEEFEGHISGLTEWGVYVELDETHIEGMSFLRDIEGDFFTFDEQLYEIIGRSTGIRMTLGSPVRIRVKRADLQKRQLDFELLLPGAAARRTEESRGKGPKVRTSSRRKGR